MDVAEFNRILALGLGRAILYVREHDASPYQNVILGACLGNMAYDPQDEGSRAEYMLELVQTTKDEPFYCNQILRALSDEADDWDKQQRFHFARLLAQRGDTQARRMMYESYDARGSAREIIGKEFIELDGIEGFLFVAEKAGERLLTDADAGEDDYLLSYLLSVTVHRYGEEATRQSFERAASTSSRIKAYKSAIEANRSMRQQSRTTDRPTGSQQRELRTDQINDRCTAHASPADLGGMGRASQ